jgi:hypothetical protein
MSTEEARAAAYRAQVAARAAFQAWLAEQRAGSPAAYLALYNRMKAIGGELNIEVGEQFIEDEEEDEQTP